MTEHIAHCRTAEIKVCMIGEVNNRILVADCAVFDHNLVVLGESIFHLGVHLALKAACSVGAQVRKLNGVIAYCLCVPNRIGKLACAVETCPAFFISGELNFFAVHHEGTVCYSVGISADSFTLIVRKIKMTVKAVKADCDIVNSAVFIGSV